MKKSAKQSSRFIDFLNLIILSIITIPAFRVLLNNQYFSMHDDQHIARLFLLDQGVKQGVLYPRWVDMLGFGYGYPLFNFYPPFIYYVSEFFRSVGFTYIWSIKLMIITGLLAGAYGMYFLMKRLVHNHYAGLASATLFTFFGYRAVTIYVRGAFAEFFALTILPYLFWRFQELFEKPNIKNGIFFGIPIGLLILTHPLIAFPAVFFILMAFMFYYTQAKNKKSFSIHAIFGGILGLAGSAFFWLPSVVERSFTLTDDILLTELARYDIHFVYIQQLLYSPWGFGGSAQGLADGMSFQLGRFYIGLVGLSILTAIYLYKKGVVYHIRQFSFFLGLLVVSTFMTLTYSKFLWDTIQYLGYLQFPWRFLTFVNIFIAIIGGYLVYFATKLDIRRFGISPQKASITISILIMVAAIGINAKYFQPQKQLNTNDDQRTTYQEIGWRISRSSFEFIPRGVRTTTSRHNTTIPDITEKDLPTTSYQLISGEAHIEETAHRFDKKSYTISASTPITFQLNNYDFPGWTAYLGEEQIVINSNNDFRLITVDLPDGDHELSFVFESTPPRKIGHILSSITIAFVFFYLFFLEHKKIIKK